MENKTENTVEDDFFKGINLLYVMYKNMGMMYYWKKDYEKALVNFEKTIEHADILYGHLIQSTSDESIDLLKEHTDDVKSKIVYISLTLGDFEVKNKNFEKAINYYKNIVYYEPNNEKLGLKLGNALVELGDYLSAVNFLNRAAKQDSSNHDIYRAIGDIYALKIKNPLTAIDYYKKYIDAEENDTKLKAIIYNSIGHLYEEADKYGTVDTQIEYFNKALGINPDYNDALRNLTVVYPRIRKEKEALECFQKIFKLGAKMDDFFDYACLNVKLKNFEEGWKYYEYRFSKETGPTPYPKINKPKWDGKKISGKTLLVQYEQGFGDTIMFFRYLEQVKPLVGKIIFRVQDSMVDFIKVNAKDIEVVGMATPVEKLSFDYHIALMSLMHVLHTKVDNIPFVEGYLKAGEEKTKKYKKEFFDNDCFKIGISWHGAAIGNNLRNIPLETFYPLAKLKKVKVYSFQKDMGSEELQNLPSGIEIIDLGKTFKDFADTAAAMANMDMFITSDNALFNLSCAMSKKTFVMLNRDSEWRWFFDDDKTPWYDTAKIFKKKDEKDSWTIIMDRILKELKDYKIG
jgi:tetratricopeptide (TPR) repeat protein